MRARNTASTSAFNPACTMASAAWRCDGRTRWPRQSYKVSSRSKMTQRIGVLFPATLFVRGDMKTSILDGKLRMCQSEAGLTGGPPEFELGDMSRPLQPPVRSLNRNAAKDLYIKNVNQRLAARQKLSWPPYMIRNAGILRASQFPTFGTFGSFGNLFWWAR